MLPSPGARPRASGDGSWSRSGRVDLVGSAAIALVTGHEPNSKILDGYMQIVDRWDGKDNALVGIGL
ncbi:hypothetical protein [Streptomyces sp. NPDC046332]|uniref:hypothetical protein n=1 Tax=Streptomyces sp. NPDC046332 TaxID=3155133 RepID=UPI0033CAD0A9